MPDDVPVTVTSDKRELPQDALHEAVVVDLIDLGEEYDEKFKKTNRKLQFVLELATKRSDGKNFNVFTRRFNAVMGERSNLEKFAADILGKGFDQTAREGFKPITLVGKRVKLLTKTSTSAKTGKQYSNIAAILPGGTFGGSGTYERWVKKEEPSTKDPVPADDQSPFK